MLVMQSDLPSQNGLDGLKLTGNSWETCKHDGVIKALGIQFYAKHMATYVTQKEERIETGVHFVLFKNLFRQSPTIILTYCLVLS